jgi:RNA polymerase sigma-70 factor (ECF subfamily)
MGRDLHFVDEALTATSPGQPGSSAAKDRFAQLLAPVLDDLSRLACRLERDPDRALDLLQEGILTAYRRFHQLERGDSFRAWLAQIVRRTFFNSRRRREGPWSALDESCDEPGLTVRPLDPEERLMAGERAAEVRAALDGLPREQRLAVLLIDLLGFSYAEAATALETPPGTVASRVVRGRAALRTRLRHLIQQRRPRP